MFFTCCHGIFFSAPSAVLAISRDGREKRSRGAGVILERIIFETPIASAVLKIEPTLWVLRISWRTSTIFLAVLVFFIFPFTKNIIRGKVFASKHRA